MTTRIHPNAIAAPDDLRSGELPEWLKEGDIEITVPPGVIARKLAGISWANELHEGASDFVVDLPERRLFIEIKDPQDPRMQSFSGLDYDLRYKYRDSFLYDASGR